MEVHPYVPTFKCLLLGDKGVGKSTFISRHQICSFSKNTIKIIGAEIHPITFHTCAGPVKFNVWDVHEPNRNGFASGNIYYQTQCAIIMFDVQSHISYRNVPLWYERVINFCGRVPIVLCGNKIESKCRGVLPNEIKFHLKKHLRYCEISAFSNYNFQKPFLYLASQLLPNSSPSLITMPKLLPPQAEVDKPFQAKIEQEIPQFKSRHSLTVSDGKEQGKHKADQMQSSRRSVSRRSSIKSASSPTKARKASSQKSLKSKINNSSFIIETVSFANSDNTTKGRSSVHSLIESAQIKDSNSVNQFSNNNRSIST